MHYVQSLASAPLPSWFQEGQAEYLATPEFKGDGSYTLGHPPVLPFRHGDNLSRFTLGSQLHAETHAPRKAARNYRMAYCATLTLHDHKGRALHTTRAGRMPAARDSTASYTHRDAHNLMERLRDDVCSTRARRPELVVTLLADGAPELWNLFSRHLSARTLGIEPVQLVDVWHALEYVAAATRLLETRGKYLAGTFRRWKAMLVEPDGGGVEAVLEALNNAGLRDVRDESGKRPVAVAIRYLENRVDRMNYAGARARGLPIGSGAVEATCKSLVAIRMKF